MTFVVRADAAKNRIEITLAGFASLQEVAAFELDLRQALGSLRLARRPRQILYDVSGANIQSQEVVQALREIVLSGPRTATFVLVNSSALSGRQLARIFEGVPFHPFQSRDEAVRWLDAQTHV